ncbi:MipA/OmpV family protein [Stenotrophomonas sp.]|uniref:MipA/OmpV family protein n=1 Tax=Stenotrophomonas sp. TaxID=69392 RepID=UPI0028A1C9E3|nr:MipA/OmpV family protein [Stenotrophomonas sp.]
MPVPAFRCAVPLLMLLACSQVKAADADADADERARWSVAIGAGAQQLPRWLGADRQQWQAIPFFDIQTPGGTELSSTDGLTVPLARAGRWQAGVYEDYLWGRSRSDLGATLADAVPTLHTRLHAGGYVEYQAGTALSFGARLGHDLGSNGAYLSLSADYDLPAVWYLQQSLSVGWRGMNSAAMRRYFGISAPSAAQLGTDVWQPGSGSQQASADYSVFVPTSQHTGLALSLEYARLLGTAADSPLVQRFGSGGQWERSLAFVYHF